MQITDIDLNLLRIFDAVYSSRNVTRAAERLNLSQPAVSHGLTRLRLLLRDPLFVRGTGGMEPTRKAFEYARAFGHALAVIEQALQVSQGFSARTSTRVFRLHMSDIGEARFLPRLVTAVQEAAPQVRIECRQLEQSAIVDALDAGRIDLAVGYLPQIADTQSEQVLEDQYALVVRRGHRLAGTRPTREALQSQEYLVVSSHAIAIRILEDLGLSENLRLTTSSFMVLPEIIRSTQFAAIMPRKIADALASDQALEVVMPRVDFPTFSVAVHWCRRFENDPGVQWMRRMIREQAGYERPSPADAVNRFVQRDTASEYAMAA